MPNLRQIAAQDAKRILMDKQYGFGWDVTVTDPDGLSGAAVGYSQDVALTLDVDTGVPVSGRHITVVLAISDLRDLGFLKLPIGVPDINKKPWIVEFNDLEGNTGRYKVYRGDPDRMLGILVCNLEFYG